MNCPRRLRRELTPQQTIPEEIANSITHGLGLVLSIVGAAVLLIMANHRDSWIVLGCGVYASTLVALYGASTLSHVVQRRRVKRVLRIWDQALIYLLIAGTFTPFAMAYCRSGWWLLLSIAVWGTALVGFFSKIVAEHRIHGVSIAAYVLLGWLPVIAVKPALEMIPAAGIWMMVVGGVIYTVGTVFLTHDNKAPYLHAVWHLFVLAASVLHYVAILLYVAPGA